MKRISSLTILGFFSFVFCLGCGNEKSKNHDDDSEVATESVDDRSTESHEDDSELATESVDDTNSEGENGDTDTASQVLPSDTVLLRPSDGLSISPIAAYNMKSLYKWQGELTKEEYEDYYHLPIYNTWNRDTLDYWDVMVDELALSRVHSVALHARGCAAPDPSKCDGNCRPVGDMCPHHLNKFVDAVKRAELEDVIRVTLFDDTGMYSGNVEKLHGVDRLDLSNKDLVEEFFWDRKIKIFFDTIPEKLWYKIDGKPVISFWHLRSAVFLNQQGNGSELLKFIKANFKQRYGVEPFLVVQKNWLDEDTTIRKDGNILLSDYADGAHDWIKPGLGIVGTFNMLNGKYWGCVSNGFIRSHSHPEIEEKPVDKRNGETLRELLIEGTKKNARFTLLEGMQNIVEGCPVFRSDDWNFSSQYLSILREFSDPNPETIRFQAEGADSFYDTTNLNQGGQYSDRSLDVGRLSDNSGWYVGWTDKGEWIQYDEVKLGSGTYRLTARIATHSEKKRIRMKVGNHALETVTCPNTGSFDSYKLVHLGEVTINEGTYDLRLELLDGGVNVDWFFVKKSK